MEPRPPTLEEWIERDLVLDALGGEPPPAFEVDDIVGSIERLLASDPPRSPVLVGPPGVGKTAVIKEVVRRSVAAGNGGWRKGARVGQVSLRALASRFSEASEGTGPLQDLLHQSTTDPQLILFMRDIDLAWGYDWEPQLLRYLAREGLPLIAESKPEAIERLFSSLPELREYLVPVPIDEPAPDRLGKIVARWCDWRVSRGDAQVTVPGQRAAIELVTRFRGTERFPRKALDLLHQTLLVARESGKSVVEPPTIYTRFCELSRVPRALVDPAERLDLAGLHDFLAERLLGQPDAVDAVVRMIALVKAGLADARRPFGVFLFAGPTGVGKTHCAQLLAEYLFGDRLAMVRVDMADLSGPEGHATLFGNPWGSTPAQKHGVLHGRMAGRSFGVLLLDELEKADGKVHDGLLQLIDEGRYTDGAGDIVSAASFIVVATSNAGAEVWRRAGVGFREEPDVDELIAEVDRRLGNTFRFEFLNRFDRVVHFRPLDRVSIRAIATRELAGMVKRDGVVSRGLEVELGAEVVDWLVAHGYHPHFGARLLRREMERNVTAGLAEAIVRHHPPPGTRLRLGVRGGRVHVTVEEPSEAGVSVMLPDAAPKAMDRATLVAEARAWVERWKDLEKGHDARRNQAAALLEASLAPGFWDDGHQAQATLRAYKALDARLQGEKRLLGAPRQLVGLVEEEPPVELLARLVEESARGFRRWLELGDAEAPSGAWLVLGPAGAVGGLDAEWLEQLVGMYTAWCRRQGWNAEVVAESEDLVVIEVEGAGAASALAMERGEHRGRRKDGRQTRIRVDVLPRTEGEGLPEGVVLEDARVTEGTFVGRRAARLKIDVPLRGLSLVLDGTDRQTLALLAHDLRAAIAAPPLDVEVARTYGIVGGAVRDPRTAAAHPNPKAVLRGDLGPFLRAWIAR